MADADTPRPAAPAQAGTISLDTAAKLIMVSPQQVMKLAREGFIPRQNSRYTIQGVVQGYIRYLQDENRASKKTAADTRVRDARTHEIELRIEERTRALVNEAIDEGLAIVDEYAGGLRSDMLSIPARVTKDLPLRRKLETEINDAFGAAAKRARAAAASARSVGRSVDAGGKAGAGRVGGRKSRLPAKRGRPRAA